MAYDFNAAVNAAQQVVSRMDNGNTNAPRVYKYPLVYPQAGQSITIRPLFNPASGQIVRLVRRHEQTACLKTYGQDCPICEVMQQVKDLTGQDPFGRTKASRSRGICYAQYITSTYSIKKGDNDTVKAGDIILFMFPWSIYQQLNVMVEAISQSPSGMDQAFCHADTGFYVQVQVSPDFKYTATQVPYMTYSTGMTDDEFLKMLDGMDNLSEQVLPSTPTEDTMNQVNEYKEAIYRQYITPRTADQTTPQPQNYSGGITEQQAQTTQSPQNSQNWNVGSSVNTTVPTANINNANNEPACMGLHEDGNPKCICCPSEMICIDKTRA